MADKPKFDPSQPFEAATDEKPKFDPSQPFTAASDEPESWGHWAGRQALGLLPAGGMLAGGAVGSGAGGAGAIPGAALGYAAGKQLERLGDKYLLGDDSNPTATDAVGLAKQTAGDLGEGAVGEIGGQALGKVLSPVGQAIANRLRQTGITAAVRHLRPTPAMARGLGKEGVREAGEAALESGAIKPFQKVGATAERLGTAADQAGEEVGNIVDKSPAMVSRGDVAQAVQDNVINPLQETTAGKRIAQPVQDKLDALTADLGEEPVPVSRIEAEKRIEAKGNNYLTSSPLSKQTDKAYASQLRQVSEDAIRGQDPDSLPAFLAAKKKYGALTNAQTMAERTAGLTDGGTGLMGHLGDVGTAMEGIEGLATGNPVKMAAPVARAAAKGRVASTLATGAYGAGNLVQSATNPVAKAIAARMAGGMGLGDKALRGQQSVSDPATIRQSLIDQQTNPSAQEELKKSQE